MPTPDLATLINAVSDDPQIKTMVKALAMDALRECQDILHNGTPQVKQGLIRVLMPALVASLKETPSGDGLEELRKTQNALFASIRDTP